MPDPALVVPGIVGAFVGAIGWLCVGLYIQRRQFIRQAKNAARAVYFEIDLNRLCVEVAREHGSYTSLSRTSFDRLLPDLGEGCDHRAELRLLEPAHRESGF